ncbi:SDR family oxidoreductase [Pseudoroseicyclus tamaricis]|uniref:SDR family oxidoreductase n=1 Tax=Pseudoroseicyclus tamaricis TaxID=2705421 RepID=A0A6B2JRE6_9RHOB|nr:SDR family oxidoreductase [Pseudoroseicyclus tamaricis]NDV00565.1 SDR family oxidoreductase [Pseudoroseicyclus tamaricis]
MSGFGGKVVAITGGASGIGLATVQLLAEAGAQVASIDRAAPGPAASAGARLELQGDVGDEAVVEEQAHNIRDTLGPIDMLVCAAGFSNGKSVPDCPLDEWDAILRTNLTGSFLWSRAAVSQMRAAGQGGSIVMIGSQLAFAGGRSNAAYLATKGALVSLAKSMAVDHAADGIRVNVLVPGAIDTPLLTRAFDRAPDPEAARARSVARHPLGRLGRPDEMARAIRFLLSDDASFTTGACLNAEGGWLAG